MQDPRNLSWLQANQVRKFPLLHGCSAKSQDGNFTLPNNLITGLYISYNVSDALQDAGQFYISRFLHYDGGFALSISYSDLGDEPIAVADCVIDTETTILERPIQLSPVTPYFISGYIMLGSLDGLSEQPYGEWEFNYESTPLDPFCIRFIAKEISAIYLQNGDTISGPFHGDIRLSEGAGISLGGQFVTSPDIVCPAATGSSFSELIISSHLDIDTSNIPYIRFIHGVPPDSNGNIEFIGQGCLTITPQGQHALLFEDKCSEPCCTCEELKPLEDKIREFYTGMTGLTARAEMLHTQVDQLMQVAAILVQR